MTLWHGLLTCFMLAVIYYDLTRYLIPNWLVGVLLLLYAAMLAMTPGVDWAGALLVAAGGFALGFMIFMLRWMGGGDIKLMIVCLLWTGRSQASVEFLVYMGLLGGLLSVVLYLARPAVAWAASRREKPPEIPRLLTIGEPVPYGLAIAGAFLWILWAGKIPALAVS